MLTARVWFRHSALAARRALDRRCRVPPDSGRISVSEFSYLVWRQSAKWLTPPISAAIGVDVPARKTESRTLMTTTDTIAGRQPRDRRRARRAWRVALAALLGGAIAMAAAILWPAIPLGIFLGGASFTGAAAARWFDR